ncbi:hypothetical protein AVEN_100266-1 [Araneus ventricosus]|uniref:Uncharacterized protein n=1 Tax=Araneus ventricosus TaxID=182803 RepID=A0A4Y2RXS2_ARAVE|nr:hypothetical protein AVEN_100266-1 [Araneus ventricosus]
MNKAYQDPSHVASFGGVDSLYRAGEGQVSKKAIQKWLQGVNAYTLHKPVRKKFRTNRVIVYAIDQQWQADLVDLISIKKFNKGFRYIITFYRYSIQACMVRASQGKGRSGYHKCIESYI